MGLFDQRGPSFESVHGTTGLICTLSDGREPSVHAGLRRRRPPPSLFSSATKVGAAEFDMTVKIASRIVGDFTTRDGRNLFPNEGPSTVTM